MGIQVFKEQLNGQYDGVTPPTMLPAGAISDGENVRKISKLGGWKVRKGCALHNTTALAAATVFSLHKFKHPRNLDYHFLAQCNGNLYDATNDPPATGTTFGSSVLSGASSSIAGFSDVVGESFFYADPTIGLVQWGGDTPFCTGFVVWDNSEAAYIDYTREVADTRTSTLAIVLGAASDVYYVCSPQIAEGITLDIVTGNTDARTLTLKSWVAGAWADRSATDGTLDTATSTKTHNKDGSITWTRNATDTMRVIGGIMGYWYQVSFSGALSNSVTVTSCTVTYDMSALANKWDGVAHWPTGARFYDQSVGEYQEALGKITSESTSLYVQVGAATTSDFLYLKTPEPATGFGIGMVTDYTNTANAQVDNVEYWDGDSWVACAGIIDETLDDTGDTSFAQSGWIWWNGVVDASKKRTFEGDDIPGHWYRISWDATIDNTDSDIRIYLVSYAPFPESLPLYKGCVQFKDRLLVWGDPEYPNRLRYSAKCKPDSFSGQDSGYTDSFGDMKEITCAVRFYNELVVFKEDSVWLLEGDSPENFGKLEVADTVGLASPQTARVVETGYPSMHRDEPMSVIIWQDTDGIYALDGRKPRKVSLPVDHYFNTEYSTAIAAASIKNRVAFIDQLNNEYHFLLPSSELVYNYMTDEFYPPWNRSIDLTCGLDLWGTDNRNYVYGGDAAGRVHKLETDTTDKSSANADVAISHSVKTRGISVEQGKSPSLRFTFRSVQGEFKAQTAGDVSVATFKDLATSGTSLGTMSMINTGYSLAMPMLPASLTNCMAVQLSLASTTADIEMWLYSILYTLEAIGLGDG